ncbi:MAG TPA: ATP-dependent sacrificial sulfur transferase LarE [Methanomassiliicoccales archaeon]
MNTNFTPSLDVTPEEKLSRLHDLLRSYGPLAVAFSGGADSTLLLKVALDTLGQDKVVAMIGVSETFPRKEREEAVELAERLGARHIEVLTRELDTSAFTENTAERCYHCKKELLTKFLSIAKEEGFLAVADGNNADDLRSSRAGLRAVRELGTHSPLAEVGLTKDEVRYLSKSLGLPTAVKPSSACLASRIPFGTEITSEKLARIEAAEEFLRDLGITQLRVRHHGDIARIEVSPPEFYLVLNNRDWIVKEFKMLGFVYVTLDIQGFRSGSMEEPLIHRTAGSS